MLDFRYLLGAILGCAGVLLIALRLFGTNDTWIVASGGTKPRIDPALIHQPPPDLRGFPTPGGNEVEITNAVEAAALEESRRIARSRPASDSTSTTGTPAVAAATDASPPDDPAIPAASTNATVPATADLSPATSKDLTAETTGSVAAPTLDADQSEVTPVRVRQEIAAIPPTAPAVLNPPMPPPRIDPEVIAAERAAEQQRRMAAARRRKQAEEEKEEQAQRPPGLPFFFLGQPLPPPSDQLLPSQEQMLKN